MLTESQPVEERQWPIDLLIDELWCLATGTRSAFTVESIAAAAVRCLVPIAEAAAVARGMTSGQFQVYRQKLPATARRME